jgi:hypothetical protein
MSLASADLIELALDPAEFTRAIRSSVVAGPDEPEDPDLPEPGSPRGPQPDVVFVVPA